MIEFCTKRRMIISIVALGVITVLILIFEEKFTSDHHWSQAPTPIPQSNDSGAINSDSNKRSSSFVNLVKEACWKSEDFDIVTICAPCNAIEINSGSIPACQLTGLKETLHCSVSGTILRSCSVVGTIEKTHFWIFESLMLLTSILSYGVCKLRTSQLERNTIKQIERRLASGM